MQCATATWLGARFQFIRVSQIRSVYMPRQAKLRKKDGQWYTGAGSYSGTYFGSIANVSYPDARQKFAEHLQSMAAVRKRAANGASVVKLFDHFLDWVKEHRGLRTFNERRLHLDRFANFKSHGELIGTLAAPTITAEQLKAFLAHIKEEYKLDDWTASKHHTSIRACFSWGAGKNNPSPCLPRDFNAFAGCERQQHPLSLLLEGELPTPEEIKLIFGHADDDVGLTIDDKGRYRSRLPEEFRADHEYRGFGDVLKVYHHTGARTSELADARVSHFVRSAKQIVLAQHKRSKTMKDSVSRRITLSDEAFRIVELLCQGKGADDPIFTDPKGRAWTRYTLGTRFKQIRARAGIRPEITIYSFRHLWISEALMSGLEVATVARMAGTSIAMVEKVYGHYRNDHFADAQKKLEEARNKWNEDKVVRPREVQSDDIMSATHQDVVV